MRLLIIAIGRLKQGPERELAERYRERFGELGRKLGDYLAGRPDVQVMQEV